MEKIIFVKKESGSYNSPLTTDEVLAVFNSAKTLDEIKAAVEKAGERLYATWATVEAKDKAGELIPIDEIVKQEELLLTLRNGPVMDEHSNRPVGQTLAYKVMQHPEAKALGVLHLNKIFNMGNLVDDTVWNEIKSNERKGSSVGGYNMDKIPGVDRRGNQADVLRGFTHMETSSVHEPCNPFATNVAYAVVAKSAVPVMKPFAGYKNFADCVAQNSDKSDPKAYCGAIQNAVEKYETAQKSGENVIKEFPQKENINKGENPMDDETTKAISELTAVTKATQDSLKAVSETVEKLAQTIIPAKKQEEEDDDDEEMKAKKKASPAKKEAAPMEGESGKDIPEDKRPEGSNEKDVFKAMETMEKNLSANFDKKVEALKTELVTKGFTPMPGGSLNIPDTQANLALDLATGKVKKSWSEVTKSVKDMYQRSSPWIPGMM